MCIYDHETALPGGRPASSTLKETWNLHLSVQGWLWWPSDLSCMLYTPSRIHIYWYLHINTFTTALHITRYAQQPTTHDIYALLWLHTLWPPNQNNSACRESHVHAVVDNSSLVVLWRLDHMWKGLFKINATGAADVLREYVPSVSSALPPGLWLTGRKLPVM